LVCSKDLSLKRLQELEDTLPVNIRLGERKHPEKKAVFS
jgi:hypothetical protein